MGLGVNLPPMPRPLLKEDGSLPLNCYGSGYTSVGVHIIKWEISWLDDEKTEPYITVEVLQ
jgi:hypothetical protein